MGRAIISAVIGLAFVGGFVVLDAHQRQLTPEEHLERYRANEQAREIAHVGFLRTKALVRKHMVRRPAPFRRVITGYAHGGAYRCHLAVSGEDRLTASLDIVSSFEGATHEISASLIAHADSQLTRGRFQEWYTARQQTSPW